MTGDDHDALTREACDPLKTRFGLTEDQVEIIVEANLDSDDNQKSSAIHYDNCAFREGSTRIFRCWNTILMESDRFAWRSLKAFGRLLHTVQDFYAHSNWIELNAQQSPIPLWNLRPNFLPIEIYSGTWKKGKPKRCHEGVPSHSQMNKDHPDEARGKIKVNGKSYYTMAKDAAQQATYAEVEKLVGGVTSYLITTKTGTVSKAGTNADIFIVLYDEDGDASGRLYLDNLGHDDFEKGQVDNFIIGSTVDIDQLAKITIGFSPYGYVGKRPGWFLESVTVHKAVNGWTQTYRPNRWLAEDEGDGRTYIDIS